MGERRAVLGRADSLEPNRSAPGPLLTATIAVTVLVGIALRVWILASPLGPADSDEAVVGLMARHFLDGEISTFYWGQVYGGALEPALVAVLFAVTGSSVLVLKLVPLALAVVSSLLVLASRTNCRTLSRDERWLFQLAVLAYLGALPGSPTRSSGTATATSSSWR